MRRGERENIAAQPPARQEQHEQHRVQRRGKRVIAHICDLLGKSLQHPVGQRIHVQDQRQRREHAQKLTSLFALV